jgi:hypothetical protein
MRGALERIARVTSRGGLIAAGAGAVLSLGACSLLLDWNDYTGGEGGSDAGPAPPPTCGQDEFCAPAPPAGWNGPVAFGEVAADAATPACGDNYTAGFLGKSILDVPEAGCSCTCGAPTGVSCPTPSMAFYSDPTCATPCGTPAPIDGSSCPTTASGCSAMEMPVAMPEGGSCSPTTDAMFPPATWERQALECVPSTTPDAGSCTAGSYCLPAAPTALGYCVTQTGKASSCPSGPYSRGPYVEYSGDLTEERTCSDCTCGPPDGGTCNQPAGFLENQSCDIPSLPWAPGACVPFPGQSAVKAVATASLASPGKCTPSGSKPGGTVLLPALVQSFCCTR